MTFAIARSLVAGCPDQCAAWIVANGRIAKSSVEEFKALLARLGDRKLPVLLNSPGGEVSAALEIGRLIRARGLDVVAARAGSSFCRAKQGVCASPAEGEINAEPVGPGTYCASACTFILAAGVRRSVMPGAYVGVHRIRSEQQFVWTLRSYQHRPVQRGPETISPQRALLRESSETYTGTTVQNARVMGARLNPYFKTMGISSRIIDYMDTAAPDSMRRLWTAELREIGLLTTDASELALLSRDAGFIPAVASANIEARMFVNEAGSAVIASTARFGLYSDAGEPFFTVLVQPRITASRPLIRFRPGLAPHRAISAPFPKYGAWPSLTGPVVIPMPKREICGTRNSQSLRLNFGGIMRGTGMLGLFYRVESREFFRSSDFFDTICI